MIAYITGSGFYDMPGFAGEIVTTRFGEVTVLRGANAQGRETLLLPRHGKGHSHLPHQINHRAHLLALAERGATVIISLSVCGILHPGLSLAMPFIAEDIHFPANRLGDGSICTVFTEPGDPQRGHLLADSLVHPGLSLEIENRLSAAGWSAKRTVYGHVPGPRFNTKVEIQALRNLGIGILSQTCGPEAVLANELELPYALVAYGVDYANGVKEIPTPVAVLQDNLRSAKECFMNLVENLQEPPKLWRFENFIYRFST